MSDAIGSVNPIGRMWQQGAAQGLRSTGGGGSNAAAISRGANPRDIIQFSDAALGEIKNDIKYCIEKIVGKDKGIGYEEINKWLQKQGTSLKNLKDLSGEKLLQIRNILSEAVNGAKNGVSDVMRNINARIQLANAAREQMTCLTNHIRGLAGKVGMNPLDVWKAIQGNLGEVQAQLKGSDVSVNIIDKVFKGSTSLTSKNLSSLLSKLDFGKLQQLNAAIRTVRVDTATIGQGKQVIQGPALYLAGQQLKYLIPAASVLGRTIAAAVGGIAGAAVGGVFIGRMVGEHLYINGKNVDTYVQQYLEKNWGLLGISSNAEWGPTALDHIEKDKK